MVSRKPYDPNAGFIFVVSTNPSHALQDSLRTDIRRQAMRLVGMERKKKNKEKKKEQRIRAEQTPTSSASSPKTHDSDTASLSSSSSTFHSASPETSYCISKPTTPFTGSPSPPLLHYSQYEDPEFAEPNQELPLFVMTPRYTPVQSDFFIQYSVPINRVMGRIFPYIHATLQSDQLPNVYNWWWNTARMDDATFVQKLAIAASHVGLRKQNNGIDGRLDLLDSQILNSIVIQNLNLRLQGTEGPSDGVLATVIAMAYQNLRRLIKQRFWIHLNCRKSWWPHVMAAYEIVRDRGGIQSFSHSPDLRQELYWIDLISSSYQDVRPEFALPEQIEQTFGTIRREAEDFAALHFIYSSRSEELCNWAESIEMQNVLELLDQMKLIIDTNRRRCERDNRQPWASASKTVAWLNPLTHCLQNLAPLVDPMNDDTILAEILRLATILYTYALRTLPSTHRSPVTWQAVRLMHYLKRSPSVLSKTPRTKLWATAVLTMCTYSNNLEEEAVWLASMMEEQAHRLRIFTNEDLVDSLKQIAWEPEFSRSAFIRNVPTNSMSMKTNGALDSSPLHWSQSYIATSVSA